MVKALEALIEGDNGNGGLEQWDPWQGDPPEDERLRHAFEPFAGDHYKSVLIGHLIALGRENLQAFEIRINELVDDENAQFLFEPHPTLAAVTLAVVRWAVGPGAGGKPIGFRDTGRRVSSKSGRQRGYG